MRRQTSRDMTGDRQANAMGRILKYLIIAILLGVLGLLGYSYSGLMTPNTQPVTQPVTLDVD